MVFDMGIGPATLNDSLQVLGPFIDLAKIAVGSARLYERELMLRKVEIYENAGVKPFLGGQFLEYVVTHHGDDMVPRFMREARELGICAIEVSDNCISLTDDERVRLVKTGIDSGLEIHGEVGSKDSKGETEELLRQARLLFEAGCDMVIFEAAELVEAGVPKLPVIEAIKAELPAASVMIELPGSWIKGVSDNDVYEMMKLVVKTFGPDVNIGNADFDLVMELECTRCGIGTAGPNMFES